MGRGGVGRRRGGRGRSEIRSMLDERVDRVWWHSTWVWWHSTGVPWSMSMVDGGSFF